MPQARALFAALVAAAFLGSLLTVGVVYLAGGFDRKTVEAPGGGTVTTPAATTAPYFARSIYAAHVGGVVTVLVDTGKNGVQTSGAGFVVNASRGLIVTNSHVVTNSLQAKDPHNVREYSTIYIQRADDTRAVATIAGYDLFDDIAVLRYDPTRMHLPALPLGDSSTVHVGDQVATIGAPFGQVESLSAGVVSQVGTQILAPAAVCFRTTDAIQTDAAINPGNSGGPLFDAAGKVIGVTSQIETQSGLDVGSGVGFAIPINAVRRSLRQITANGTVRYAWLGVGAITLTPDIVSAFKLRATSGAQVTFVDPKSAAAKAGISSGTNPVAVDGRVLHQDGDVIVSFDGKPVRSLADLQHDVAAHEPGDHVTIGWWHGAARHERSIVLGVRDATDPQVCAASAAP